MINDNSNAADIPKTVELLDAKEHFDSCLDQFLQALPSHNGETYLPPEFATDDAISVMASKWGNIYKEDGSSSEILTGLLCATPTLLDLAKRLNDAKKQLQTLIVKLRAGLKSVDAVRKQLHTVGMAHYDLIKTYQRVIVLEHRIESISWTWAIGHKKVEPISVAVLRQRAREYSDHVREKILTTLQSFTDSTVLARVKTRKLQLRANVHEYIDGEVSSHAMVTSGPMILSQATLPSSIIWCPKPSCDDNGNPIKRNRKTRSDAVISTIPACTIEGIEYFTYLQQPKTNKRKPRHG